MRMKTNQQKLRERVRILKAIEGIKYKELAEDLLQMSRGSFYNFLTNGTNLSREKARLLEEFINDYLDT